MRIDKVIFLICLAIVLTFADLLHAQVPALVSVPQDLPEDLRVPFVKKATELKQELKRLAERNDRFLREYAQAPEGSAKAEEARREQAGLQAAKDAYVEKAKEYNLRVVQTVRSRLEGIDRELSVIDKRMAATRKSIATYSDEARLKDYAASLDEWAKLPGPTREKARHAAIDGLLGLVLEAASIQTEKKMELTQEAVEKLAGTNYQRFLSDLERQTSRILQKELSLDLNSLRDRAMLIRVARILKDGMVGAGAAQLQDREQLLTLSLKLAAIVNAALINNPGIALLVVDAEVVPAAAYGWTAGVLAQERVNQLVAVGEAQLRALQSLTTLYRKDVDKHKALLESRDKLAKYLRKD